VESPPRRRRRPSGCWRRGTTRRTTARCSTPPPAPSAWPTPPPAPPATPKIVEPKRTEAPAISPEEARRLDAARAAIKKARDFGGANPDKLDEQAREWEQARTAVEGTPFADEAKRELAALAKRLRDRVERELSEPINAGLLGYWKLDEANGSVASDFTAAGRHGTLKGGASWAPGRLGGAVALDGIGGHVAVPHQDELNAFPLTACAWVKTSGRNGGIVNKYVSGSHVGYQIYLLEGKVRAWYFRDRQNYVFDPKSMPKGTDLGMNGGPINDGRWHHVALVVDPAGGRLYVDGAWKASLAWTGTPGSTSTSQELGFGRYPGRVDAPDGFLSGSVDEVRIYNRALSDLEVRQLATPK